jgi:ATP-binding cassette, subfamily B, bacterial CvaB/MchF/RaxB
VNEAIKDMKLTRIVVAHRPETIAMASRVIVLDRGKALRDMEMAADVSAASGPARSR